MLSLALASIACQIDVGGPEPPGDPIPVSTEAAAELEHAWESAVAAAAGSGRLTILLTEAQVTSFVALRLDAQEDPLLTAPQVYLREGMIQIHGKTRQGVLAADVLITVTPTLQPDGTISFEVTSADLGPLPAPAALRQSVSAMLTEAFTSPLGSLATGFRITTLVVDGGEAALVGEIR
ncbi:MAG: hypothetical protein A2Z66_14255 [Chloroflexi bacterium RBG_13_66_10]|nr:MAG: hypothetical protein A2Z66_14255 [Chloroflexi bacterium RBG_13_66_10]